MTRPTPAQMTARLRSQLSDGRTVLATFVKLPSTEVIDLAARSGYDAVIVDREHAQLGETAARRLVTHATAIGLPAIVRLPEVERGVINRFLEAGAVGIQLSMLTRRDQVDRLVSLTRYPPGGTRSINLAHVAAGFGTVPMSEYLDASAPGPLLVGQIETRTCENALGDLVVGLDVAFCGTTDLSVDLGQPGQLDGPLVNARVEEIARAVISGGTSLGAFATSYDDLGRLERQGARYVAVGSDLGLLAGAFRRSITATPGRPARPSSREPDRA